MANLVKSLYLLAILVVATNGYYPKEEDGSMMRYIIKLLSNNPEKYTAAWEKLKEASNGKIGDTQKYIPKPYDDSCRECGEFIEGLKMIATTVNIEIVKFILTPLCIDLLNEQGTNGDIICPSVIDNYAHHVFFIFGNLNKTGSESCALLNFCSTSLLRNSQKLSQENQLDISEIFAHIQRPVPLIPLPNLQSRLHRRSNNTIKVAHLTDIHVEDAYVDGSPTECDLFVCCQNDGNGTSGSAHPYGDYNCNLPPKTVDKFLDFVSDQNPDIVIYTGDSPSHSLWKETLERQRDAAKWVADSISQRISGIPAYPAFGNHENFPTNMFYAPDADVQTLMDSYYQSWMNLSGFGSDQNDTIKTAGYYFIDSAIPNVKIVSINSNYGYTDNWYNLLNDVEPGYITMKQEVEQAMDAARVAGQKVLLLVHHNSGGNALYYDEWMTHIYESYKDIILITLSGHTHDDQMQLIYDRMTGSPIVTHLTAPSMDSHGGHNPGARIIHLDATDFTPLDYQQYRIDLNKLIGNPNEEPDVELLYTASEVFGLNDLTPASFGDLLSRFEADDALFNEYWSFRSLRPESSGTCMDTCKHNEICRIKSTTIEQLRECQGAGVQTTTVGGGGETTTTSGSDSIRRTTTSPLGVIIPLICTFLPKMF